MRQGWRWFGPGDPIPLQHVRQAGASDIVTALHEIRDGRAWRLDEILERKRLIEAAGLTWSVCESIPLPSSIKLRDGGHGAAIEAWKQSLANLGRAGVGTVCYNFMPVVDWTRTDLAYRLPTTGLALRFDAIDFAAYDVLVLRRPGADADYSEAILAAAEARLAAGDAARFAQVETNVIAGLPGGDGSYSRATIRTEIARFDAIDDEAMRANLIAFLREVVPVAEEFGVRLAIHPDDPPFSLFGLPRVVSTAADARRLLSAVDSPANGLTLCAGSYGARADNDLVAMAKEFGPRVHFAHLRNVTREPDGSFYEAEHLDGDTDMVGLIEALVGEERRRRAAGETRAEIVMRPDHGHALAGDIGARTNPGYSYIGRLKGLAELRGVLRAVEHRA